MPEEALNEKEAVSVLLQRNRPEQGVEGVSTEAGEDETQLSFDFQEEDQSVDVEEAEETSIEEGFQLPSDWPDAVKDRLKGLSRQEIEALVPKQRQNDLSSEREELEKLRAEYAERLQEIEDSQALPPEPDPELIDPDSDKYDPDEYNRLQAKRLIASKKQKDLEQQKNKLMLDHQKALEQDFKQWQDEQKDYYRQHMPEVLDPEKGQQLGSEIVKYATSYKGITVDDLKWANAAQFHILSKAMKYDALVSKKSDKPKATKHVTPGASGDRPDAFDQARKKLARTGSDDAAIELLLMKNASKR